MATAYVVDLSTDRTRTRNMGRMALSTNLGFILGPMIAGVLGATALGEKLPVLAAIGISVIGLLLIVFLLPESRPAAIDSPPCGSPTRRVLGAETRDCYDATARSSSVRDLLRIKNVPLMFGLYFFIFFAFNTYYASFPMHAVKALKWDTAELGFFFSFASAALIVVQGPVLGYLGERISAAVLFGVGAFVMFFSFYAYSLPYDAAVYIAALLFAIGNGIMWPSYMSMLATLGPAHQKGAIQGVAAGIGSLASILGLLLGGYDLRAVSISDVHRGGRHLFAVRRAGVLAAAGRRIVVPTWILINEPPRVAGSGTLILGPCRHTVARRASR